MGWMSSQPNSATEAPPESLPALAPQPEPPRPAAMGRATLFVLVAIAGAALVSTTMLWQRLNTVQEQLARQSADSGTQAIEARTLARQAQEQVRDALARQTVLESKLNEVT